MRPRAARRAAAQLQSLYDSSVSFSNPTDVVSPVVQVCNFPYSMHLR